MQENRNGLTCRTLFPAFLLSSYAFWLRLRGAGISAVKILKDVGLPVPLIYCEIWRETLTIW